MKKLLLFTAALLLTSVASAKTADTAFNPDIYVGAQGGIAYDGLPNNTFKGVNFGGRAFAGYNFTQHLAIEAGVLLTDSKEVKKVIGEGVNAKLKFRQQILDFTPRINIPLDNKFTAYAKAGIACLDYFESGSVSKTFNMTYGLGIDYKITDKLSTGFAWNHYNGGSTKIVDIIYKKYQPSLDFYALSLTYSF